MAQLGPGAGTDLKQSLPANLRTVVSLNTNGTVVVRVGAGSALVQLLPGSKRPRVGDVVLVQETPTGPVGIILMPTGISGFNFVISEAAPLTVGLKGVARLPFRALLTGFYLYAAQAGSVEIDLKRVPGASYAGWLASAWTSIPPALSRPAIVSALRYEDSVLTGWDTGLTDDPAPAPPQSPRALLAGDVLGFEVISATTITAVTVAVEFRRLPE